LPLPTLYVFPPFTFSGRIQKCEECRKCRKVKKKKRFRKPNSTERKGAMQGRNQCEIMYAVQLYPTTCMAKRAPAEWRIPSLIKPLSSGRQQPATHTRVARRFCRSRARRTLADLAPPAVPMGVPFSSSIHCTITSIVVYFPAHMSK
jgi:hypothetical protein